MLTFGPRKSIKFLRKKLKIKSFYEKKIEITQLCPVLSHVCDGEAVWPNRLWANLVWIQLENNWRRRPNLFTESDLTLQLLQELTHWPQRKTTVGGGATQPRLYAPPEPGSLCARGFPVAFKGDTRLRISSGKIRDQPGLNRGYLHFGRVDSFRRKYLSLAKSLYFQANFCFLKIILSTKGISIKTSGEPVFRIIIISISVNFPVYLIRLAKLQKSLL